MNGQMNSAHAGKHFSPGADAPASEVQCELNSLTVTVERLIQVKDEMARRLQPVSRGLPPENMKGAAPSPVLGSPLANTLCNTRSVIEAVIAAMNAELDALAI